MHHKIIDIRNPIDFNPKLILFSCRQKTSQDTLPTNAPDIAYLPADIVKNVLIFLAPVPDLVSFSDRINVNGFTQKENIFFDKGSCGWPQFARFGIALFKMLNAGRM